MTTLSIDGVIHIVRHESRTVDIYTSGTDGVPDRSVVIPKEQFRDVLRELLEVGTLRP